jgi:hypothetical protein
MLSQRPFRYLLIVVILGLYILLGYGIQRHETLPLLACYAVLFLLYAWIILEGKESNLWLFSSLLFRAVLLFSVPALSDDFYRFIWDGRLLNAGYHPFADVPSYYLQNDLNIRGIDAGLYDKLNSKNNFTVYPPLSQFVFWLSVKLSPGSVYGSVVVMKLIIFICEAGTILMIKRLLRYFDHPSEKILMYALNPLVIIELTGNVHFEGIVILFLLIGIWFIIAKKYFLSAIFYSLSICTKLIPLIFLPLLLRQLGWRLTIRYWLMTGVLTTLFFIPLLDQELVSGFAYSMSYYFQKFEFNASIYYLVRALGFYAFGFNIIHIAGVVLACIAAVAIFTIALRRIPYKINAGIDDDLFKGMLWCLFVFFLLTTTLHPWYIITLLTISIFTPYRFPVLWSGLIFLTYAGYKAETFTENLQLVAVEYIVVIAYLFYETLWTRRVNHS